ncbi:MAG: heme-binding domain-containing protein [Chitinophagaceae bacterium]
MKKVFKKIFFIGLAIFILIQFYQPARNVSNGQVSALVFTKVYTVPIDVQSIFKTSCYDCHSNNTSYPCYAYIQPARWFMEQHIKDGKSNLNFDEWGIYSARKQENKLNRIVKQIKADEMPLASYTMIHKNAKLSDYQKEAIVNWINTVSKTE